MNEHKQYRFLSKPRKVLEDQRFVRGGGHFIADVQIPGMKYVEVVRSPFPCADIRGIDAARALEVPGVVAVVSGEEISHATLPILSGLEIPNVRRYPLAVGRARYAGEWVAAVVADSRAIAEDAAELVDIDYEPQPFVLDAVRAQDPNSPIVHPLHGSNILLDETFEWGDVDNQFNRADHKLAYEVHWGRNSTVPIETFGAIASWDSRVGMLDVWASVQMPKYLENIVHSLQIQSNNIRVHYDVDVGGSFGTKRGIKHTILVGYLTRKLGCPVRFIEDRLEYMSGGDAHGPDRLFNVELAYNNDGRIVGMKMEALEDLGAYTGRAPMQLGKPAGSICGPYKIGAIRYRATAVTTNKTVQDAVRGFGQSPTNYALETGIDKVSRALNMERNELRKRNFIKHDEFPYVIPSGAEYDSGDYVRVQRETLELAHWEGLVRKRDALRAAGGLAGIGISSCLEPGGGNAAFEPLLNSHTTTTTSVESARVAIGADGVVTVAMGTSSAGQGHETLASAVAAEVLEMPPDDIRVVRVDSLSGLPTGSPVASRMAIMLGGAVARAATQLKQKLIAIGAYCLGVEASRVIYQEGKVIDLRTARSVSWIEMVTIAHRQIHRLAPGLEPGLTVTAILQVPKGGMLPDKARRVRMYPCYSFEFHVVLVSINRISFKAKLLDYFIGHDCGTVITPSIVRGMVCGGIAHGIGAALYEKFEYGEDGQLLTQTFMDYPIPSTLEVPDLKMCECETPSPLTSFGQKGVGEGGYMGSPAAIASGVNDALVGAGYDEIVELPMTPNRLAAIINKNSRLN